MSYSKSPNCSECGIFKVKDNTTSRVHPVHGFQWKTRCRACSSARLRKWREENPERFAAANRRSAARSRKKYKKLVFDHYGLDCKCCGESRYEFLTIDHIEGGGNEHRRQVKVGGSAFYQWLVVNDYPKGYRTLCWNCNTALGMHGYCPHDREAPNARFQQNPVFGQTLDEETHQINGD